MGHIMKPYHNLDRIKEELNFKNFLKYQLIV